jgi:hypothetical protein
MDDQSRYYTGYGAKVAIIRHFALATARASAERTNVLAAFNVPTRALDSQEQQF